LFQYIRLPYGVKPAAAIFQSSIDQVLSGLENVCCYIDDFFITSKDMASHVSLLEEVLTRLRNNNILGNKSKCEFRVSSVSYLGHNIDKNGVKPLSEKVEAIKSIPRPQNVSQLKTFMGAVTFYHKLLQDFASVSAPLYNLTKTNVKWYW
jgi:hypothetical protein